MADFFEKRDRWGHGMALWVMLAMVFLLPLAVWSLSHITLENDVAKWLSDDTTRSRQFRWYENHFAVEDSFLLTWDGSHIDDPRVEAVARQLMGQVDEQGIRRGGLKQIKSVRTPQELVNRMTKYHIPREEAIARVTGVLAGPGKLWVQLTSVGQDQKSRTLRLLSEGAQEKFGLKIAISDPFQQADPAAGEFVDAGEPAAEEATESADEIPATDAEFEFAESPFPYHDLQISWEGMYAGAGDIEAFITWAEGLRLPTIGGDPEGERVIESCFQYPGSPAAMSITLSEAGQADLQGTFNAIREIAAAHGIDQSKLHFGGSSVTAAALNQAVLEAVWNQHQPWYLVHQRSVIGLSGLVGALVAFWLLRSVRLAAIVLTVAYFMTLVAVSLVPATGGTMNLVLVVMPTLLLVITISGSIHLANYWKHEAHLNPVTAISRAVATARQPCLLAVLTTAIGLASLTTSNLTPVRDFGLYSAIGTLLSVVAVLYCLPALLQIWPGTPPAIVTADDRRWRSLGQGIVRYSTPTSLAFVVLFGGCLCGLQWFQTETKVIRYFAPDSRVVSDYHYLEENLAGIVPVETVVRFSREAQEELNFLERMEVIRRVEQKVREVPDISGTISLADFQPALEELPEDAGFREKIKRNARAKTVEDRVRKDPQAATFVTVAEQPGEFNEAGDELWRITAQVTLVTHRDYGELTRAIDDACQAVTRYHPGTHHIVTGLVPLFQATQQAVLDSLIESFGLAFAIIAVVMMVVVRNPAAGLLSMFPNLLPVGTVFGLISWFGLAVDIGTMVTASVALGIAIDGTLHMLAWFRNGILRGATREEAVIDTVEHCGPAIWQTSLVVAVGLLVLYPAELLLVTRFGCLMAALVSTALIGDILLLPALLAGPLGSLIERTCGKERQARMETEAESQAALPPRTGTAIGSPAESLRPPHISPAPAPAHRIDPGRPTQSRTE